MTAPKLVILDRDGVINEDSDDYIKSPAEWIPIPGSAEAIARLNKAGYTVVVATNQSGIGRHYFTLETLDAIHEKMQRHIEAAGGDLAGIFGAALQRNGAIRFAQGDAAVFRGERHEGGGAFILLARLGLRGVAGKGHGVAIFIFPRELLAEGCALVDFNIEPRRLDRHVLPAINGVMFRIFSP